MPRDIVNALRVHVNCRSVEDTCVLKGKRNIFSRGMYVISLLISHFYIVGSDKKPEKMKMREYVYEANLRVSLKSEV